jgi:hypothetical protein
MLELRIACRGPAGGRLKTLKVDRRYNGPPASANGGYACGAFVVAAGVDMSVRLLVPPPLDADLFVSQRDDGDFELSSASGPVAVGRPSKLELEVPSPPPYVQAVWASQHYAGFNHHAFPDCFVCGPHRRRGDGMRIFPGMLETGIVAAPWLPADDLDAGDGKVAVEFHWAALDCPGYFALCAGRRTMVLGEMHAHVDRCVRVGESCTVIGWKLGADGRKHYAGTAIFDQEGELCARARATWIELKTAEPG